MQDYKYLLERQIGEEIKDDNVKFNKFFKFKKIFLFFSIFIFIGIPSILGYYYFNSKKFHVFKIKNFEIVGVVNSSKDKILKILEKNKNKEMEKIYQNLIKVKWIDDVILRKKLPSTLVVKIIEKKPVSILEKNGILFLIDRNGGIIDRYQSKYYRKNFIIFKIKNLKKYDDIQQKKVAKIIEIIKKYPFAEDVSDITINGNDLSIILTSPRMKILISMDNLEDEIYKISILKKLANTKYIKKSAVAKLDYKNRIYLSRSE